MGEHGLLMDVMVYLAAAVVCVPIASRLKLGSVLGYLIAGCIIGPWGFRFVHEVESILHFAEFGVVLMLFLIGLELDPKRLWSLRRPVFGGGTIQMASCGLVLFGGLFASSLPWQGALVGGFAMALSSTAIAIQTMRERGVLGSPMGNVTFSILLFQDVAAIPLIAIVPLLSTESKRSGSAMGPLKVLAAIVIVVVIGRYLTRPIMRVVARTGLREMFTGFSLLLVIGIAEIMSTAGVSMALGAFLAGVLLASSEYRHALETDIEPFKGLLMGLFFIAVGMSINFGLLRDKPLLVLGLTLGLVVLKGGTLAAISRFVGVHPDARWQFAALLAQGGEFAFVVFGVASQAKLLPGQWDAVLTLVVALSMALTPLLLLIHDRVLRSDRSERDPDAIEHDGAPVIIAGFGRYGQIVGRMLFASGIRATVLDHDPDQIEMLRKFGFRVFYGDATRLDLLHAAGAEHAKLIVVAVDDQEASIKLVELVREHFPKLQIVSRARNVTHWVELRKRGVERIQRETFESALRSAREAFEMLGISPYEARERADRFRLHNLMTMNELLPAFEDETRRMSMAKAGRQQLESQFARDAEELDRVVGSWSPEEEREPASER